MPFQARKEDTQKAKRRRRPRSQTEASTGLGQRPRSSQLLLGACLLMWLVVADRTPKHRGGRVRWAPMCSAWRAGEQVSGERVGRASVSSPGCCELLCRSSNTPRDAEQASCSQRVLGLSPHLATVAVRLRASPFPPGASDPSSRVRPDHLLLSGLPGAGKACSDKQSYRRIQTDSLKDRSSTTTK